MPLETLRSNIFFFINLYYRNLASFMIFSKEYRINYYSKYFEKSDFFVDKDMLEFNFDKICVENYYYFKKTK